MIAVDRSEQDKGYSDDLLAGAMKRIAEARRSLGLSIAVLDVLEDGEAVARRLALYASYGFQPFAERALRMWVSVRGAAT
jgi:ribosomal protein S18 acetylase RimI-like enzyme